MVSWTMLKSFDSFTKIKFYIDKTGIRKITNNFIAKNELRKEQFDLSQVCIIRIATVLYNGD